MSVESMAVVLNHSKALGTAKLILVGIANHDGDGGAWPAMKTLARYGNVTQRTARRIIEELEEMGEVKRHVQDGGPRRMANHARPNRYEILVRCPDECDRTAQHRMPD